MHHYNTRFAAQNRSSRAAAADRDDEYVPETEYVATVEDKDEDYVVNLGNWDPSTGRRPVTRSMTRSSSRTSTTEQAVNRGHHMMLRSARR